MDILFLLTEIIDLRSFSNLWYWIALGAIWSQVSRRVFGIPHDVIKHAQRFGGAAQGELEDYVRLQLARLSHIREHTGVLSIALVFMVITCGFSLGFVYQIEFAQATFLMFFPLFLVQLLTLYHAEKLRKTPLEGQELCRFLLVHRLYVQLIGVVSIFCCSLWGMYQNLHLGAIM